MLEAVSVDTLTARPMFFDGLPLLNRTWWTREHEVGLALLCRHKAAPEKAARCLGRLPSSIAHRAYDTGLTIPKEWRDLIRRKTLNAGPRVQLAYPYISDVRGEHTILLAVNTLVPRGLADHMRADVCQEIMLAIFEGLTSLPELQACPTLVRKYVTSARKANYEAGGYALSLDMPMRDGRHWYDVLPDRSGEQ